VHKQAVVPLIQKYLVQVLAFIKAEEKLVKFFKAGGQTWDL